MSEALDLDGIEARANDVGHVTWPSGHTILALVAEVRALRAKVEAVEEIVEDGPWFCVDFHGEVEVVDVNDLRRALSGERLRYEGGDALNDVTPEEWTAGGGR